ncbi:hypothetical protein [Longimicrobium sp.]|uniref:hypothetical protein n=1 Tax=Longimicrobium sp. TaxID=2029185 RepID=UPI002E37ED41|nr:hypothetical protein [Longimicrobium sp.]HEX6042208.1 hypothetical protein [Longimicrobium sp.]
MTPRIKLMLESRQLEEKPAPDEEIQGMWSKAVRTYRGSALPDLDADSAFTLAYQGALQAATAIIRAAGYRVYGDGHHQHTFDAVAALGAGDLSEAARELNIIRQRRHRAVYDWTTTEEKDLARLRSAASSLFQLGCAWLRDQRPGLDLATLG